MSSTIIYGIKRNQKSKILISFDDSHGFGTVIWTAYFNMYLNKNAFKRVMNEEDYDKLWPLYLDDRLPYHHKIILQATYDYSLIPIDNLDVFIESSEKWNEDFSKILEGQVNHVLAISSYLKENIKKLQKYDCIGIQTSDLVSNQYDINWNKSNNRGSVSLERLYNLFDSVK